MDAVILYSTWPDLDAAKAAARDLVEAKLAACVTVLPGAISTYRWENETRVDGEVVMFAKTKKAVAAAARVALLERHPYDIPCVLALDLYAEGCSPDFLTWINAEIG